MLVALRQIDNQPVHAGLATSEGPFVCPNCLKEVVSCQSGADTRHFIHKSSLPCLFDAGESEAHRRAKSAIFEGLRNHPAATQVQLERSLGSVRPDVFARIRGVPVAFEMQISTLSPEAICRRTEEYARLGIAVLWLLQWTPELITSRYSPRLFERWLHATYFGRVYFWRSGLNVFPYHFHDHHTQVEERRWRDERGRPQKSRGYRRASKRYKMPICGRMLHLVDDFRKSTRNAWESPHFTVPACGLYMDTSRVFPE